ncbi:hypothetical protein [Sphingomonas sp.]|uniref:hypothetical protein n=1 Tax=Sphingomonas sp. TaxID=28214 RepID=UPI003D6D14A8
MAESGDLDHERMKRFMDFFATEVMAIPRDSDIHPLRVLQAIEERSPSNARKGLRMAVNDMVEMSEDFSLDEVTRLDARLSAQDALTLSQARLQFSRRLKAILKRGWIRGEMEYHLVRNAAECTDQDMASKMWPLLATFELEVKSNA